MTKDELFEKLLWEKEIYPPSVLDSHYYDTPEMTRIEIILKTLREMGVLLPSGEYAQSRDKERDLSIVITELQRKLPPGPKIRTCAAFKHLNAGCCGPCHTNRPHYNMELIDAPDGTKAWVCCAMKRTIYLERYAEGMKRFAQRMGRFRNSPEGKRWRERFGGDGRTEN
jgi:hypothetical protein